LITSYSYELGSNDTTMLELCRSHWKVEGKWYCFWYECIWDEMAWRAMGICIYRSRVKRENENAKSFVYEREMKSLKTLNQMKQSLETLNQRK